MLFVLRNEDYRQYCQLKFRIIISEQESLASLFFVALLWGTTNPFIKKGARGLEYVTAPTKRGLFLKEIQFLVTNLKYMVPFIINQAGSLLYFLTLGAMEISLAVPVANSLTFIFTAVTGWLLGEEKINKRTYIGVVLIILGTFLCCWDKMILVS